MLQKRYKYLEETNMEKFIIQEAPHGDEMETIEFCKLLEKKIKEVEAELD